MIDGGAGNDTIQFKTISAGVQLLGGAGADSIYLASGLTTGTIGGGTGHDTITLAGTDGVSTKGAVTTIDGGAGTDYIYLFNTTGAAVDITTTMSDKLSQGTFSGFQANVQYGAGDVLNLATSVSVSGSNFTGAGASIYIISQGAGLLGASGVSTGQGIGGILAYETGGETYFFINSDDESENYAFVVEGKDLITTTATGSVNVNTSNFQFSVASVSGTAGAADANGVQITLL